MILSAPRGYCCCAMRGGGGTSTSFEQPDAIWRCADGNATLLRQRSEKKPSAREPLSKKA